MSRTLPLLDDVTADASLSPCGTYRYLLSRKWQTRITNRNAWTNRVEQG